MTSRYAHGGEHGDRAAHERDVARPLARRFFADRGDQAGAVDALEAACLADPAMMSAIMGGDIRTRCARLIEEVARPDSLGTCYGCGKTFELNAQQMAYRRAKVSCSKRCYDASRARPDCPAAGQPGRYLELMADSYIATLLRLPVAIVPQPLIEAKRAHLRVKRELRQAGGRHG